jgi:feruloyl esterase
MIKRVESNEAPDRVIGTHSENGKQIRTRPLCPFPKAAKYKGKGNKDEAENFACQTP